MRPELCLIDELAHTNAPGLEHGKRYEDIDDVLSAGTDVFSTVNVQHLESLNDQIAEMTGVRVRETFPDGVLTSADEVVLIDLTPEALIQRLREGKVYPPERIESALTNFFRFENLATLREIALAPGRRGRRRQAAAQPNGSAHARTCSSTTPPRRWPSACSPWSALGRARSGSCDAPGAPRSASRPSSTCSTSASPARRLDDEQREQLDALRRLASVLGAHLLVEEGDDVAAVAGRVAAERGTTYVMIGEPRSMRGLRRFGESLPERLLRKVPGRRHPHRVGPGPAAGACRMTWIVLVAASARGRRVNPARRDTEAADAVA